MIGGGVSWRDEAACVGEDPELWFADEWTRNSDVDDARRICAGCPVAAQCLADGLAEEFGMRAGLTATQRARRRNAA